MPVFVKISNDGNLVYVVKTLFCEEMTSGEFEKKAKCLKSEVFLAKFPLQITSVVKEKIKRLKEIEAMKLSRIGRYTSTNIFTKEKEYSYIVGDKVFKKDYDDIAYKDYYSDALEYCKKFYGDKFMEENCHRLEKDDEDAFFSDKKSICQEEYASLKAEVMNLTHTTMINVKSKAKNAKR